MKWLKIAVIIEAVIIVVFAFLLIEDSFKSNSPKVCEKYVNNDGSVCLLSPRIYTGIIPPESYLILNFKPLKQDIEEYLSSNNLDASVYVLNIKDGASFGINSTRFYDSASLSKIPVAIMILNKVENGEINLSTELEIMPSDRSSAWGNLYKNPVKKMSVRELLRLMLSESDNTALNVLSRQGTFRDIEIISNYLDYFNEVDTPLDANYTSSFRISPKSTANIFLSLYLSTILHPEHSELILSDLINNSYNLYAYANIPENVVISHKFAASYHENGRGLFHDCGIMYINDSRFFYCIMTEGIDSTNAPFVVGNIVNKIYTFIDEERKNSYDELYG